MSGSGAKNAIKIFKKIEKGVVLMKTKYSIAGN